jgi:hypothetical protein
VPNTKTTAKTRWTRDFKLRALSRMEAAAGVTVLAAELGCRRGLLHIWRREVRTGGADAPHPVGRRPGANRPFGEASAASPLGVSGAGPGRIGELQRKIGQPRSDRGFFRPALRHVREARPKKGEPGETASTRRSTRRRSSKAMRRSSGVPVGRGQPGRLLPALASLGAAPAGDGGAR